MTAAITPLKTRPRYKKYSGNDTKTVELGAMELKKKFKRIGMVGAIIAKPARMQTIKLTMLHFGLIIRDLGKSSRKSAPLIPKESEMLVKETIKNTASAKPKIAICN